MARPWVNEWRGRNGYDVRCRPQAGRVPKDETKLSNGQCFEPRPGVAGCVRQRCVRLREGQTLEGVGVLRRHEVQGGGRVRGAGPALFPALHGSTNDASRLTALLVGRIFPIFSPSRLVTGAP